MGMDRARDRAAKETRFPAWLIRDRRQTRAPLPRADLWQKTESYAVLLMSGSNVLKSTGLTR
jgi:hypothetical protein